MRIITENSSAPGFQAWFASVDMPNQDERGDWYDMDTGQYFRAPVSIAQRREEKLNEMRIKHGKAIDTAEAKAKESGWAALTGTAPQKAWAAQIRAKLIPGLICTTAELAARIKPAKFWIDNRDMRLYKLSAEIDAMRGELEAAAATRKEAAVKAKQTKAARKAQAMKLAARDAVLMELLDGAVELGATPAVLGAKVIATEADALRVFVNDTTKLVTFIIKSERKVVKQATLDANRKERMKLAMA